MRDYRGVNILTLRAVADELGYTSGTYKQWAKTGEVRKGKKAAYVVFYEEITVASEDSDAAETRLFARATPVFAAERVDGYEAPTVEPPIIVFSPIEATESFVAKTGAIVHHSGSRAFYRPSTHSIQLLPREAFVGSSTSTPAEAYASTKLHEVVH